MTPDPSGGPDDNSESVGTQPAFQTGPFKRRISKPWGWELHWTRPGLPFMGKVLHINSGARLSLQVHDAKSEAWLLISGRCAALLEDGSGNLIEVELQPGEGIACLEGQRHRLVGITDCEVVEVSTPERGTTRRIADDYQRPDETPFQRGLERGERA